MINLNIPFNKNPDGWHCIHVAMNNIIKHFLKQTISPSYLNALMAPVPKTWVWPFQAVKVLDDLGLYVKIFSNSKPSVFINPDDFSKSFPEEYVKATHFGSLKDAVSYVNKKGLYEKKTLSIIELESFIHKGALAIVLLGNQEGLGKYVTLTGYDNKNFYYHDSGPFDAKAHKEIPKEKFIELWAREPSSNTAILVLGKKSGNGFSKFNF